MNSRMNISFQEGNANDSNHSALNYSLTSYFITIRNCYKNKEQYSRAIILSNFKRISKFLTETNTEWLERFTELPSDKISLITLDQTTCNTNEIHQLNTVV
jgi:hypothetical protein